VIHPAGPIPAASFLARVERFATVGSTNDVVRGWLRDGTPEVCLAVADEQTAGRGRLGRTWQAPPDAALLLSLGFRPSWLAPDRTWRLAATVALAMCDAAEDAAGLPVGAIRLKWPNDLVIQAQGPGALLIGDLTPAAAAELLASPLELRKVAGILGESDGLGAPDPTVVVGIGINADWEAESFPPDLADRMTSLRAAAGGRPVDREDLLAGFLDRLEARLAALRAGFFDIATWAERQALTGHLVRLDGYPAGNGVGTESAGGGGELMVDGVDGASGGLVVRDPTGDGAPVVVHAGEVVHVRLAAARV
jgi:BirA family biotin operon repressor/biotin-[acetyl-CoA-carboxylase] ligase